MIPEVQTPRPATIITLPLPYRKRRKSRRETGKTRIIVAIHELLKFRFHFELYYHAIKVQVHRAVGLHFLRAQSCIWVKNE